MSVDTRLINEIARLISAHQLDPSSATLPDTTHAVIAAVRRHDQSAGPMAAKPARRVTQEKVGIVNWVLLVVGMLVLAFTLYARFGHWEQ